MIILSTENIAVKATELVPVFMKLDFLGLGKDTINK